MAKVLVFYEPPKDLNGFEEYYHNVHVPLVQTLPNLKGAEIHRVLQTQNSEENWYLFAELQFDSPEEISKALESPEGLKVQGDILNLMPFLNKPPIISIVD